MKTVSEGRKENRLKSSVEALTSILCLAPSAKAMGLWGTHSQISSCSWLIKPECRSQREAREMVVCTGMEMVRPEDEASGK